ncbi:MAG: hypothetical protein IT355_00570 [Gemmatimonadaceae bacterium]|nr:hypothetical protein [Gemmatimonadaceae bacterium]
MNLSTTQLRMLGSVMYFAAVALIINYFAQLTIQVWPIKVSELNWRVGAAGLFMDALLATVVPLMVVYFAAFMNNDRKMIGALRWLCMIVGLVTAALLLAFALDSVQIRAALPQNVKGNFMKVALRAALIGTLLATLFVWVSITMGKVLKSQGTTRTGAGARDEMLMVGTREPARTPLRAIDTADAKAAKEGTTGLTIDM